MQARHIIAGIALLAVSSFLVSTQARSEEIDKAIHGAWAVIEYDQNGTSAPADIIKAMKVVIRNDRLTIAPKVVAQYKGGQKEPEFSIEAGQADEATLRMKPEKGWIDLVSQVKGEARTIKGIYLLSDDYLSLCFAVDDKKRPKKLPDQPKSGLVRLVLKRVEK